MKRLATDPGPPGVVVLLRHASSTTSEEFSLYYDQPAAETTSERIERREIVAWGKNPKDKQRIGFLHKYETKVVGSRAATGSSWYIFDRLGVTAASASSPPKATSTASPRTAASARRVDEDKVVTTGLKIFFGLPLDPQRRSRGDRPVQIEHQESSIKGTGPRPAKGRSATTALPGSGILVVLLDLDFLVDLLDVVAVGGRDRR